MVGIAVYWVCTFQRVSPAAVCWVCNGQNVSTAVCWVCTFQRVSPAAVCWVCNGQRFSTAVYWVCTFQRVSPAAVCWVCNGQRVSTASNFWVCTVQRVNTTSTFWVCPVDTESFGEIRTKLIRAQTDRSVPVSWLVQLIVDFRNIKFCCQYKQNIFILTMTDSFTLCFTVQMTPNVYSFPIVRNNFCNITIQYLCSLYRDNLVLSQDCRTESRHVHRLCDCGC